MEACQSDPSGSEEFDQKCQVGEQELFEVCTCSQNSASQTLAASEPPGGPVKQLAGPRHRLSDPVGLGGVTMCISSQLLGR